MISILWGFLKNIKLLLDFPTPFAYNKKAVRNADLAHLVERHLAKVEVASSSLVVRSIDQGSQSGALICFYAKRRLPWLCGSGCAPKGGPPCKSDLTVPPICPP